MIPVSREVRRCGGPGGTVLAFTLAAPLLNPISLLYGLTLAEPRVILAFLAAALVLSTAAGVLWDRVFAPVGAAEDEAKRAAADAEPLPAYRLKRLAAVVPFGAPQHTMKHADPTSPLLLAAVAVPTYSTPLPGMMRVGLMFDHGNSIGAAFVLFVLGIGLSLGTLAYLGSDFGWGRIGPWAACYLGVVLGLGYLAQPLLYDSRKVEIEHTHAFDDFSNPFPTGWADPAFVWAELGEKFGPLERPDGSLADRASVIPPLVCG